MPKNNGKIQTLNPSPIILNIKDGFYLGHINEKYGYGMVVWNFIFDAAHYEPHKYTIKIYGWDSSKNNFDLKNEFVTENKFADGESALKHYKLPYKNYRSEIISTEVDLSTLGIESRFLKHTGSKKKPISK
ncbi:MAG TPA: hypothetical protein VGK71_02565 [Nitrospirota bacterium]